MADTMSTLARPEPLSPADALKQNIHALAERRRQEADAAPRQEKAVHAISEFAGSMPSVYLHLVIYGVWLLAGLGLLPFLPHIDPQLSMLGSVASLEAIFLATFVLISQNRSAAAADRRADLDLHISLLTEHELTKVAALIGAVAAKLGVEHESGAGVDEVSQEVAPEAVLDAIEAKVPPPG